MHNIVIDRARAQQRRPRELFTIRDSGDPRSGDPVTAVELRPALLAGLGALTSQQRAIVVLRYFGPGTNPKAPIVGDYRK